MQSDSSICVLLRCLGKLRSHAIIASNVQHPRGSFGMFRAAGIALRDWQGNANSDVWTAEE